VRATDKAGVGGGKGMGSCRGGLLSFRDYYHGVVVSTTITKIFSQATINQLALSAVETVYYHHASR
jgi:hypothetical protein